jgi:hypothetical protein
VVYAPMCCFAPHSLLILALLPRGDESAMNPEAVGISLAALFPSSCCVGVAGCATGSTVPLLAPISVGKRVLSLYLELADFLCSGPMRQNVLRNTSEGKTQRKWELRRTLPYVLIPNVC